MGRSPTTVAEFPVDRRIKCVEIKSHGDLAVKSSFLLVTILFLIILTAACENGSTPTGFRDEGPGRT